MKIIRTSREMMQACKSSESPLGLVPTMGYLHEGHIALVRRARSENSTLAVSIFVNPTQFGANEDFDSYPRDPDRDFVILEKEKVDLVFVPTVEEMFPLSNTTWIDVNGLALKLEGKHRPGHFRGVSTVVTKLFNIVRPQNAYFGQKDGQQAIIIKHLIDDLHMNISMIIIPTIRDPDGLALSSRNIYLSKDQREAAPIIYTALLHTKKLWNQGVNDCKILKKETLHILKSTSAIEAIDYLSIANIETLDELEKVNVTALVSVAVRIGKVRLIDNLVLGDLGSTSQASI